MDWLKQMTWSAMTNGFAVLYGVDEISAKDLKEILTKRDILLVDVREV